MQLSRNRGTIPCIFFCTNRDNSVKWECSEHVYCYYTKVLGLRQWQSSTLTTKAAG